MIKDIMAANEANDTSQCNESLCADAWRTKSRVYKREFRQRILF